MITIIKFDGHRWIGTKIEHIDVRLLRLRHRHLRPTDPYIQRLRSEINERGRFDPIWVRKVNGKFEILQGHHRVICARLDGVLCVPAYIFRRYRRSLLDAALRREIR